VTVTGSVTLPIHCGSPNGPLSPQSPISVPLNYTVTVPAKNTNNFPAGGNQNLAWINAVQAPNGCAGGLMYNSEGATFNVTVSAVRTDTNQQLPTGIVPFQFHYRVPAAKGKSNSNCTNPADPGYNKADVCGASWSETKEP
jgi:hypothetical protein